MPIYEYKCSECGVFEVTQRITEDPLDGCPTCQGEVRKLISNTSFQLKGTGWYITDYGRGKGANGDKQENDGGKDSSDSAKSTESKSTENKSTENKTSEKSSSGATAASTA